MQPFVKKPPHKNGETEANSKGENYCQKKPTTVNNDTISTCPVFSPSISASIAQPCHVATFSHNEPHFKYPSTTL